MIEGIIFVFVFIIGFAFGIAMLFILKKLNVYKEQSIVSTDDEPKSTSADIIDEWLNGKRGE